jgi:hypothetical protein
MDFKGALHNSDAWSVDCVTINDDGNDIAVAIRSGTCRAVSDGSYKEGRATSAFTLHGNNPAYCITACNAVSSTCKDACAYRGELGGIFGTLMMMEVLCRLHNITSGLATLGLDGWSTFPPIEGNEIPAPHTPHYDLILAICYTLKKLPITIHFCYVEGHQDKRGGGG